jgi:hypothetical protein
MHALARRTKMRIPKSIYLFTTIAMMAAISRRNEIDPVKYDRNLRRGFDRTSGISG